MNKKIGERLVDVRKHLGYNQQQMANILGVSQGSLSKFEKNQNNISDEAKTIIFNLGISLDWLIIGEGEMMRQSVDEKVDKLGSALNELFGNWEENNDQRIDALDRALDTKADKRAVEHENRALRQELEHTQEGLEALQKIVYREHQITDEPEEEPGEVRDIEITYLGRHSAAGKAFSPDNYESMVRIPESFLPADKTDLFTGKIEGTSMGDIIPDGSYVLLRHMQTPIPISGRVYVFTWNGENTIKKFRLSEYGPQFLFLDGSGRIITPKENEVWTCQAEFVCVIPADKIKF